MKWFFYEFTLDHPFYASAIKFLILGTMGEWLGGVIRTNKLKPFPFWKFYFKILIWAFLGILIKWIFASFVLMVDMQVNNKLLPVSPKGSFIFAFFVSLEVNLFFGPFLMYFHRFLDNIVDRTINWKGLHIAIYSIGWFWIPLHTITFMLPENLQIIFAAFLSLILGIILGYSNKVIKR